MVWCFTLIPTAALLRSLQWVSYRRVLSGHCASPTCHSASPTTPIRPPSGNMCDGVCISPQLRCSAACSGFHIDVSLQDTAHLTHAIAHLHMAQCISHMTQPSPIAPPMFRDAGPTIRNPLQAAKQRRCGVKQTSRLPLGSA